MNTIFAILLLAFSIASTDEPKKTSSPIKNPRIEKTINSQWTFNYFPDDKADKGYESVRYNDSKWPAISIPHTWSTYETTGEKHPFIKSPSEKDNPYWWTGWGWYRKHFTLNPEFSGKKVFVEFEGVQKYCKVWINGKYLGDHNGGYGSFDFDITDNILEGKDNVLVVAVNNQMKDLSLMAAGNFNVYGGICRDVTIVLKDKLYIPMQGSASHEGGTFVTTSGVSEKQGIVRVQTWVKNDYPQTRTCLLNTYIIDAAGKVIEVMKTKCTINSGQIYRFDQTSRPVKNPYLWSPETPYMYKVYSEVTDGNIVTDAYSSTLGFRWFRWDYKENFLYVNGKKVVIHGGNRLEEYPWLGDAIPEWITGMDFEDIDKNLNFNFMRTAHYPNDRFVYDLTDKLGIIICEESPGIQNQDFSTEVREQQMKEMIRRDRNHPSIMMWSMGNETDHAVDSKYAVAEDTTRILIAQMVTDGSAGKYIKLTDENLPVENISGCAIRGWYNNDKENIEPVDQQQCFTEEYQQTMLKASGRFGTGNLYTLTYADHGADCECIDSPLLHINPKGFVDVYRVPKYAYYFWQATYLEEPMVFIQPHYWRSQYLGQKKNIIVSSNCERVELKINGTSKGVKIPDQSNFHSVTFENITIEPGTITATGTKAGKNISSQVVMVEEPARIILHTSHQKFPADRGSVAIVTADIVDSEGNHVYGANNTVRWSVSGPATLVGPSRYESDINKRHEIEGVWYIDMPVSNVIRSTGKPGTIHITVSASGLASGQAEILSEEVKPYVSAVIEPVLENDGREPVDKEILSTERLEEIPREIILTQDDLVFPSADKPAYSGAIREYIQKNNPSVDTTSFEFREFVKLLTIQLANNKGHLIADDFNFNAEHYNLCRLISGYINATKLPSLYKETLKKYYAESIIRHGNDKNAGDEMNWLNWIPSGGTVVVSQEGNIPVWPKGSIVTSKNELADLIAVVYPVFVKYSDEAKERALTFISKMNPYITIKEVSELSSEGEQKKITRISYLAEKGKPILIPLIKFISE